MTDTLATEISTETTFVVKADDLARILHNAALATDTGRNAVPILSAVRLELDGSTLLAVATDRYRLHTDTAEVAGIDDATATAGAQLDRADVAAIVKLVKGAGAVTVTISGRTVAIRTENTTATYSTVDGEFPPRWRSLIPERATDTAIDGAFGFNPQRAADFSKVIVDGKKSNLMRLQASSANKPFRVEIGKTFVGLLMPVRLPEQSK